MKKPALRHYALMLSVVLVAFLSVPSIAFARTVTAWTAKDGDLACAKVIKNAKAVKTGTQTVKVKNKLIDNRIKSSYVKFKATKTKTYTFTFSGLKSSAKKGTICLFLFESITKKSAKVLSVKTNEGKTKDLMPIYDAKLINLQRSNQSFTPIKKRTVRLKMTKGQTVYIPIAGVDNAKGTPVLSSLKLNIQ